MNFMNSNPLVILVGPSGSGKSSVLDLLLRDRSLHLSRFVTTTTRAPRAEEKNGVDYWFTDKRAFLRGIKNHRFYEWAQVYGEYYGSDKTRMKRALGSDKSVILTLDTRGAETLKREHPDALIIFIDAPIAKLRERLRRRNSSPAEYETRLRQIVFEKKWKPRADIAVMNHEGALNKTVACVAEAIKKNSG